MNPGITSLADFLPIFLAGISGLFLLIAMGGLALWVIRRFHAKRAHARGGKNAIVTLLITIPRYKNDEETKRNDDAAQLKEKIAIAETLFSAIGGLKPDNSLSALIFGRTDTFSFELVAHEKLVSFYVSVPKHHQEFIEQQIHAQWSDAFVEPVVDYNFFSPTGTVVAGYLKLTRENVIPVKTYKDIEGDPLNALTNALSKVGETDGVAVQYVIRTAPNGWRALGRKIAGNMQKGMSYKEARRSNKVSDWTSTKEAQDKAREALKDKKLSPAETKMLEGIENKLSKAGFETTIRVVAAAETADEAQMYLSNVLQAFGQYNIYEFGNSFAKSIPATRKGIIEGFIFRTYNPSYRLILNTEELASLWHLPMASSETPNIRWMSARSAPVPTNMHNRGLHLGYNEYRGQKSEVYISEADRRRHMYIIGKTGSGKTEFIKNLAVQDIKNGKGVAVIDPHGDLADDLMGLIPKHRIDDVIYFNPSDTERPMGLNMLEVPEENMRDFAVQEMISIFYMLFPPEMIGPMFEHSMRNYMLTLMADLNSPGTLVEIPRMISDEAFQKTWIAKVKDPLVRSFWEDEMAKTSDYHKSEMMGYLVSKVGRFVENEMMRNIIGQTKSAFNFRDIMDNGKILLVNLSKGKTGEVNAALLGLILVAKLQMAAFTRADLAESERRDFYLYIDEFQNFVTPSIATILSEARKYRLNLIMAHQYMGQLVKDGKSEIRDAVLGNVGTILCGRVGPEDIETLGKIFDPTFSGQDLMNTDMYAWNIKMIIDNAPVKPFTIKTVLPPKGSRKVADALKEISRLQFGLDKEVANRQILERAGYATRAKVPPAPPSIPRTL